MRIRKWRTIGSSPVYKTPIFDLHRRRSAHPHRGERDFFILDAPHWVNIIPLTRKNEVVMVRQFRHGISGFTLEIPGGMVDPEDPHPQEAARREMIEECGYDSDDIVPLGRVHPNAAIQPNYCFTYLARKVRKVAKPVSDGAEETQVTLVPLKDIPTLIGSGRITHALVIAAFSFFHVYNPPRRGRLK
ncbi:MAG TPA: NUDIX hydrolase [Candidatus Binataceae bacterium]|nr:NUDIX hydrolase [Candidatus Binataceae bacterium]